MPNKTCCIVSENGRRDNQRLRDAFADSKRQWCQFTNASEELYEYEENFYCLLHLPPPAKKEKKLNSFAVEKFNECVSQGKKDFSFVCLQDITLTPSKDSENEEYYFCGAWIWSFNVANASIESLDIRYSKIQGVKQIVNSKINRFYLKNSDIVGDLEFSKNRINLMLIEKNYFVYCEGKVSINILTYGLTIKNGWYTTLRFKQNKFKTTLTIKDSNTETLEFQDDIFYVCPDFFQGDFKKIDKLILPEEKSYILHNLFKKTVMAEVYTQFKCFSQITNFWRFIRSFLNKEKKSKHIFWKHQYRRFREIYNITKERKMYIEQSCYFALMQICLRKDSETAQTLKIMSWLYGDASDYGQSITKPLRGLLFWFALNVSVFWWAGVNLENAAYLSFIQVKPYALFYEEVPQQALSNLCEKANQFGAGSESRQVNFSLYLPAYSELSFPDAEQKDTKQCHLLIQYKHGGWLTLWSILSSTGYIIWLTCLGLALRWNFRKA